MGRTLQIIIRIQVIDPCFMMNKNRKEYTPKILLTQGFDRKRTTIIEIQVNKENVVTPRFQVYAVTDAAAALEKCRLHIQYMVCYIQDFNQKILLDVKYISLNHMLDALKCYESIHKHGETWGVLIPPYPTIYKVKHMGDGCNRQFLSSEMMSKNLYTRKLIARMI